MNGLATMRAWIGAIVTAMVVGAVSAPARDVVFGDTKEDVLRELGPPAGSIKSGTWELYRYDLGRLELSDGRVTAVDMITPEQAAARRQEAERQRAAQTQSEKERQEARITEGRAVLLDKLADPAFAALPGSAQIAFWEEFMRRYPEVDAQAPYQDALRKRGEESRQAATERRLAAMEQRVQDAEARAQRAEADARSARDSWWPTINYAPPVVFVPYPADVAVPADSAPRPASSGSSTAPSWVKPLPTVPVPVKNIQTGIDVNGRFQASR